MIIIGLIALLFGLFLVIASIVALFHGWLLNGKISKLSLACVAISTIYTFIGLIICIIL